MNSLSVNQPRSSVCVPSLGSDGLIGGMRAIFLSMLTYMQATLAMLELVIVRMPSAVGVAFAIVTYALLLGACASPPVPVTGE